MKNLTLASAFACLSFALVEQVRADVVTGGTMTQNLNSSVFRDPASTDAAYLAGFGITVDPAAPLLIFGKHFDPVATTGVGVTGFRPLPVNPGLTPTGSPELPRTNYRDDAASIESSIGSSSALIFGVNASGISPSGLPGRNEQSSTLSFDPTDFNATVSGSVGLDGATSFWYANVPVINTGSVWLAYGDFSLSYDATRAVAGDSGWFFTNNLLFPSPVYDIQNFNVTNIVAATESTPGSFTITGDLYTSQEFRDGFGLKSDLLVGSFTLNATTAVPEPGTLGLMALGAAVALVRRRRRERF